MNNENQQSIIEEGKTTAIIAYITIIGLIIAFIQNNEKKNAFAAFHIRQCLGIFVTSIALIILSSFLGIVPVLGWMLSSLIGFVVSIGALVLWILGLINAINGQDKPVPILGEHYQKWFESIQK